MCGIVGAYGEDVDLTPALKNMFHRGPDGKGTEYRFNSSLGHTRLAIVDLETGDQPLYSPDGQRVLICNGEIYNHADLRARYPDYDYQTASDSESILALYDRFGAAGVAQLDGMFAFALMGENGELLLARDPLGIKPLYYAWDGDTLYFASEVKALHKLVDKVEDFPPGHYYTPETGFVQYYDVWDAAKSKPVAPAMAANLDHVRQSLREAVKKRLMADVPVGVFLSGGLDSSIIAALVKEFIPDVHSFAVGMADSKDRENAKIVAEHLGTQHHEFVYTRDEMIEALPDVIYHLESFDPSLVRSAIPNYFLARMARQYVTVVLSGEGADELYAGYHYFKRFLPDKTALHRELVDMTSKLYSCNLIRCDRMTMAHSLEARVPFLDTDFIEVSFKIPVEQKVYGDEAVEKWALRKAFEDIIPQEVAWRVKEQFSKGAGSAYIFEEIAEDEIGDDEFATERQQIQLEAGVTIQTKEELYYYRIYRQFFTGDVGALVQRWTGDVVGETL